MNITVIYHANFNGTDININGECQANLNDPDPRTAELEDKIIDWAGELCDDDGQYDGSHEALKRNITSWTMSTFNEATNVEVIIDEFDT